jgi:hypothetical protein
VVDLKKKYVEPNINISYFEEKDIIFTSTGLSGDNNTDSNWVDGGDDGGDIDWD